jgi:GDP-L-fucose synthase
MVVLAAARVGGIMANSREPVEFLSDNLRIQTNVLDAALEAGVPRLLFLGSSCIYPRLAEQPIREETLLTGALEPTNDAYAIAKIAGLLQVKAVRRQYGLRWSAAMPTNLYGPGDNFDPENSHLVPGLIRRFHAAVETGVDSVTCWGTGAPRRELLHVDDAARACLTVLEHPDAVTGDPDGLGHLNIGTGQDHTVRELAGLVAGIAGFRGEIRWDSDRPDGTPRKLLDVSRLSALGWAPRIGLADGLAGTYRWYREALAGTSPLPGERVGAAR